MLMTVYLIAAGVLAQSATKPAPSEGPLRLTLVPGDDPMPLDLGGQTAEQFKERIKAGPGQQLPPAQPADFTLRIENTSEAPVQVWVGGDPVVLTLNLKGPGAVDTVVSEFFTREFRIPRPVAIPPGKAHEFKLTALDHGFRMVEKRAYWTAPGEYTLTATLRTGVNPAPEGVEADEDGFGMTTFKSEPVNVTVK